jgi:hypothetical protein
VPLPGSKTWPVRCRQAILPAIFFFAFGMYVMYISIFLHMLLYKDIEKIHVLTSPRSCNPCHSELGFPGTG